jgi:hypothetical protein
MAAVSGSGIALALDDFMYEMKPTSYAEQIGSTPTGTAFNRGDLRWYGANLTGAGDGTAAMDGSNWQEGACDADSLNCPRGGVIHEFAPFDNPYILRTWSPAGVAYDGSCINGGVSGSGCAGNATKSIYEYLAPGNQPDYTYSFWGEAQANYTGSDITDLGTVAGNDANNGGSLSSTNSGTLKSQTIIRGNAEGSVFMLFQSTDSLNTLGMIYDSHLQGGFHFSLNQTSAGATDVVGEVPVFSDNSGLYFKNVHAQIPFGQPFYQALVLGPCTTSVDANCTSAGGMYLAMPKIPSVAAVYNTFYGLQSGDTQGYDTARMALPDYTNNNGTNDGVFFGDATANYQASHGYSYWGDWYPDSQGSAHGGSLNGNASDTDGVYFKACPSCASLNAFASRPMVVDVRGFTPAQCATNNGNDTNCMEQTQNYAASGSGPGPISPSGTPSGTNGSYGNNQHLQYSTVNLGDARIAGLLIQNFQMINCSAGPNVCN